MSDLKQCSRCGVYAPYAGAVECAAHPCRCGTLCLPGKRCPCARLDMTVELRRLLLGFHAGDAGGELMAYLERYLGPRI